MTILSIAGLLVLLIGLLAFLTLERRTARSYADAARANMAVESGLSDALVTLSQVAGTDDTLVFRIEDPVSPMTPISGTSPTPREQFFTYGAQFDVTGSKWRIIPFFSGARETTSIADPGKPNAPDATAIKDFLTGFVDGSGDDAIQILGRQAAADANVPRAKWVNPAPDPNGSRLRYAWWVEDLAGRVDGRIAGAKVRDKGVDTAELGIFTWFNTTADADGAGPEDSLIAKRDKLRTAASVDLVMNPQEAAKVEPFLTYSLPPETAATPPAAPPPLIPHGFGYADAGKPAKNLNEAVASADVDGLAAFIESNLPNFASGRKGGFPASEDYLKTLAASMIDYADTNSTATTGTGYRGVDSYPFVNEMFDRYEWTNTVGRTAQIKVSTYVEFWNPSQLQISGLASLENRNAHQITIPLSGTFTFGNVTYGPRSISLPPNGFGVYLMGEKTYTFATGAFPPSTLNFPITTTSSYDLRWNGRSVDTARGGLQRTSGTLKPGPSERKWKGHGSPAHDYSIGQMGDPRSSWYINTWVFANNYDENSSWGGRNFKRDVSNENYREVKISRWQDRGSDSTPGTKASGDGQLPTEIIYPVNQPKMAPAFISNAGRYESVAEIGNIFDPAQWSNIELPTAAAEPKSGGGFTLAIGRPEFGRFDAEGRRAAQLLDLFHVIATSGTTPPNTETLPKINVNTAPREVLRTLIAGVSLTSDLQTGKVLPPRSSIVGDLFAEAVINSRNLAPLRGNSDLALVRKNPAQPRNYVTPSPETEPFFGSRVIYPANSQPPDTWNDAGREELFRKVINLVSFQGKSFRIVIAGESLDKDGKTLGRAAREIHVAIEPARDITTGLVDPSKPLTIRKLYEKAL